MLILSLMWPSLDSLDRLKRLVSLLLILSVLFFLSSTSRTSQIIIFSISSHVLQLPSMESPPILACLVKVQFTLSLFQNQCPRRLLGCLSFLVQMQCQLVSRRVLLFGSPKFWAAPIAHSRPNCHSRIRCSSCFRLGHPAISCHFPPRFPGRSGLGIFSFQINVSRWDGVDFSSLVSVTRFTNLWTLNPWSPLVNVCRCSYKSSSRFFLCLFNFYFVVYVGVFLPQLFRAPPFTSSGAVVEFSRGGIPLSSTPTWYSHLS